MMTIKHFGCQYSMIVSILLSVRSSVFNVSLYAGSHIQFDRQHSTFSSILSNHFGSQQEDRMLTTELHLVVSI